MATTETVTNVFELLCRAKPASWASLRTGDVGETIEAWELVLRPVPDGALMKAAVMLAGTPGPHLPDVGTLMHAALDLLDEEPPVAEAWALVVRKARGNQVDLPPRARAALEPMGNPGDWQEDELAFRRREFEAEYAKQAQRWRREAQAGRLALPNAKVENFQLLKEENR